MQQKKYIDGQTTVAKINLVVVKTRRPAMYNKVEDVDYEMKC